MVSNGPEFFCFISPKSTVYQSLPASLKHYQQQQLDDAEFASIGTKQLMDEKDNNQHQDSISCIPSALYQSQILQVVKMGADPADKNSSKVVEVFNANAVLRREK